MTSGARAPKVLERCKLRYNVWITVLALLFSPLWLFSSPASAASPQCVASPTLPGCQASAPTVTPLTVVPVVPPPSQAMATATATAQAASLIGIATVETQLQGIRDRLQARTPTSRPLGYADDSELGSGWQDSALGYAAARQSTNGNSSYAAIFKAPPKPEGPSYSAWAQGFGDYETRSGTFNGVDIGRTTGTYGGVAGVDVIIPHFWMTDAVVFGVLAGDTESHVSNADGSTARLNGPGVGAYGMLVNGGFSADSVFKADFFGLETTGAAGTTPLHLVNLTSSNNVYYKFDRGSWWYEPTAAITYTNTTWDSPSLAAGLTNGEQWRWQAGARIGTSFAWNGATVEPTLTGLAYDDFSIRGGTIVSAVAPLVPTDEGKIFGQAIAKLNFDWGKGLSSYIEGEVRGREDVVGVAGRLGVRYTFGNLN